MPLFSISRSTRRWATGLVLTGAALALGTTPASAQSPGQWRPYHTRPNYCPPPESVFPPSHPRDLPGMRRSLGTPPYELAPAPVEGGKKSDVPAPPTDPMQDQTAPRDPMTDRDSGAQQDQSQPGQDQAGQDQQGLGQQDAGQGQDPGAAAAQAPATTRASQAASSTGAAPNMIGDFFGGGGSSFGAGGSSFGLTFPNNVTLPNAATSVVGRQKIAENTSIIPVDRVFLNFNYFDNVPLTSDGVDVVRFTPGFERTLFDGRASVEVRFPFAATLDNNIGLGGVVANSQAITSDDELEFGNINIALKALLYEECDLRVGGGLAFTVPTADDIVVREARPDSAAPIGTDLLRIENQALHILPFVGAIYAPQDSDVYLHGYAQLDFDVNGNTVFVDPDAFTGGAPGGLSDFGDLNDVTFVYIDVGAGYWLTRNYDACGRPRGGIALTAELHYSRSLTNANSLVASRNGSTVRIGESDNNIEVLNGIVGGTYLSDNGSQVTLGVGAPIAGFDDEQFDWELRAAVSWYLDKETTAGVGRGVRELVRPADRMLGGF